MNNDKRFDLYELLSQCIYWATWLDSDLPRNERHESEARRKLANCIAMIEECY